MRQFWTAMIVMVFAGGVWAQAEDQSGASPDSRMERAGTAAVNDADANSNASAEQPAAQTPLDVNLSGADLNVTVVGDRLVITGVKSDVDQVENFIDLISRDVPEKETRVVHLKNRNAQAIAQVIEKAAREMAPSDQPEQAVTVATVASNILLMTGPSARLDELGGIVEQLDQVDDVLPKVQTMTYPLKHIKAAQAKTKLEELINAIRQKQGEDPANQITVMALDASNSLYVIAPETEHEKIAKLIEEIDIEPVEGYGDLKLAYFPLINSKADKLADVLNDLFQTAQGQEELAETIRRIRMVKSVPGPNGEFEELPPINLER
ncbi:MAG TPA: secretin N-terminal domain-containing protein, partial [Phycisphaerae bacterium]|nr:secretin N-terminal domain-containing protein [Phycisphaerae bacterium]